MANWIWLLLVCLGHNLCCWAQQLGQRAGGRDDTDLLAKRLRYRYLIVRARVLPARLVARHRCPCHPRRPVPRVGHDSVSC
jgi:hypothetical protein